MPEIDQAPMSKGSDGQVEIWLDRAIVDRFRALRGQDEGYSDVILRLAKARLGGASSQDTLVSLNHR